MDTDSLLPHFVAIGASGGEGLNDIVDLLKSWPLRLPAVVMIVLHRPSDRVSHLQDVLRRATRMPVLIATEAERLSAGSVYIGKPDEHLTLMAQEEASLIGGAAHKYRNRTIDLLFDSIALHARERAVGIVFSGSLDDGSRGLAAIHAARGYNDGPQSRQQAARHAAKRNRLRWSDHVYWDGFANWRCGRSSRRTAFCPRCKKPAAVTRL